MKTQRFVLTYTGEGLMPSGEVKQWSEQLTVLDQSRQNLLVEDAPEHLTRLLKIMPHWKAGPERLYKGLSLGSGVSFMTHHRLVLFLIMLGLVISFPVSCQG